MTSPYWLLPAFLLLSYQVQLTDTLGFHAALACVPLAVFAGDRHGWRGVGMVVVGGLLLPFGLFTPVGGFPARLDIYLVSISTAALLAARWPMAPLARRFRSSFGFLAALALLPVHVLVAREGLDSGFDVVVIVSLLPLLHFLLFLLGWAQAPALLVLGPLALATAAGIGLAMLGSPWRLHYALDTPADFLTGLAIFHAGRYAHDLVIERASDNLGPRWPMTTIALLLLLWGGYPLWQTLVMFTGEHAALVEQFAPLGSALALPLAALLAGWRYRWRGVVGIVAIAAVVEASGVILHWGGANLGILVVATAFGTLGNALRDRRDGTRTPWPSASGLGLALVGAVSLPLILGLQFDKGRDLLVLALGVVALLVLPAFLGLALRRAGLWLGEEARRGWRAMAGLFLLLLGLLSHLQEALVTISALIAAVWIGVLGLGEGASSWRSGDTLMMGIGFLFYFAMLLTAVAGMLNHLPAVIASTRELIRWLRAWQQPEHPMTTEGPGETIETKSGAAVWLTRLARGVGWVRNALMLMAVVITLLLLMEEFW
ncbi:hypothetical protein DFP85_106107 [Halomonas ventosae]|uniref:Uncharacterized protein n=1 Tax=Halomonas ventosae TaxID=229007 RepID=A0A4R6ZRC9_9GAMM|nr:hypothetical protein [Halomonas ventosae]TDR54962.1 hypothetical protein DFP85_106107 [Halomonas ventosae]